SKKYGIETLLKAFSFTSNPKYKLMICGDGDAKDLVYDYLHKDDRIKYLGKLPHDKTLLLQKNADLLVNPRTPKGEFTKFSFPSKTMEYLALGTPVLMYKLPGIPNEYFNYCYTIDDYSHEALANKINEILSLS